MTQTVRWVATELVKAWNDHDVERIAAFIAPEYLGFDVGEAAPQQGPEGVRQMATRYLQAFPDLRFKLETIIAQGDRVVLVWMARGTHQGKLMNIPATGRTVSVRGISLLTVKSGKVTGGLCVWDVAGLLRALGLLPELRAAS